MVCITCETIGDIMEFHVILTTVATVLVIIGAINWGLVGLFGLDLVASIFGEGSVLARIIYVLVGLAGLEMLLVLLKVL